MEDVELKLKDTDLLCGVYRCERMLYPITVCKNEKSPEEYSVRILVADKEVILDVPHPTVCKNFDWENEHEFLLGCLDFHKCDGIFFVDNKQFRICENNITAYASELGLNQCATYENVVSKSIFYDHIDGIIGTIQSLLKVDHETT